MADVTMLEGYNIKDTIARSERVPFKIGNRTYTQLANLSLTGTAVQTTSSSALAISNYDEVVLVVYINNSDCTEIGRFYVDEVLNTTFTPYNRVGVCASDELNSSASLRLASNGIATLRGCNKKSATNTIYGAVYGVKYS